MYDRESSYLNWTDCNFIPISVLRITSWRHNIGKEHSETVYVL